MRIIIFGHLVLAGWLSLFGCSKAQPPIDQEYNMKDEKILIVYLTRTKNTKAVAEIIRQNVGGDMVEIELQNPYPENYQAIVAQVDRENETNYLPELKTKVDSLEKYDVVFVGAPTWDMQLPPPMKSFLKQNDLRGKTVIPFNTNAGYGAGNSFSTIRELCPGSKVLNGLSIKGGKERDGILFVMQGDKRIQAEVEVIAWLKEIAVKK